MRYFFLNLLVASCALACLMLLGSSAAEEPPASFESLFNERDLSGWKVPEGDHGHWRVVDGVIDYDGQSEAPGEKDLWTVEHYQDFVLRVDWRIKETPFINHAVPIILPDGSLKLDSQGNVIRMSVPDSDSGIYLRGSSKAQVGIWCWPIGSGHVYGYAMDPATPPEIRAALIPKTNADRHLGQWNQYEITLRGSRLSVILNGVQIIDQAKLPGIPDSGPIALQHHGTMQDGRWTGPPSLVQFRNIFIKKLD